ncbi:uncharacterized protein LOC144104376 isoform X1 [Amblyomma americanum]
MRSFLLRPKRNWNPAKVETGTKPSLRLALAYSANDSMTPQSECYHQFTACPEDLKANLSSFENGYTLRRDLICDANAVQVYQKIDACLRQDRHFLEECIMTHIRNAGEFSEHQICRVFYISNWCARNTFAKSCPAESNAAIAFLIQASASFLLLHGCL